MPGMSPLPPHLAFSFILCECDWVFGCHYVCACVRVCVDTLLCVCVCDCLDTLLCVFVDTLLCVCERRRTVLRPIQSP